MWYFEIITSADIHKLKIPIIKTLRKIEGTSGELVFRALTSFLQHSIEMPIQGSTRVLRVLRKYYYYNNSNKNNNINTVI